MLVKLLLFLLLFWYYWHYRLNSRLDNTLTLKRIVFVKLCRHWLSFLFKISTLPFSQCILNPIVTRKFSCVDKWWKEQNVFVLIYWKYCWFALFHLYLFKFNYFEQICILQIIMNQMSNSKVEKRWKEPLNRNR